MPPAEKSQNVRISQMRLNFNLPLKLLLDLIIYQLTLEKHFITKRRFLAVMMLPIDHSL